MPGKTKYQLESSFSILPNNLHTTRNGSAQSDDGVVKIGTQPAEDGLMAKEKPLTPQFQQTEQRTALVHPN